jgi:hypothetical protein
MSSRAPYFSIESMSRSRQPKNQDWSTVNSALSQPLARWREHDGVFAREHESEVASPAEPLWASIVIRLATAGDRRSLERLAELDCSASPSGPALIGVLRERPVAAVSLSDGKEVADPFVATGDILQLMRLRARQLNALPRNREQRGGLNSGSGSRIE